MASPASRPSDPGGLSPSLNRAILRFGNVVRGVGVRHGLTEAELDELLQEVRIRLWRSLGEGEKIEGANTSYVYRTAMSAAIDMIRRRRTVRKVEIGETETEGDWMERKSGGLRADHHVRREELAQQIERALNSLGEARRAVVQMHLGGYQRTEIADLLGWTEAKTRNLLYRGLADLRAALEAQGIAPGHVA